MRQSRLARSFGVGAATAAGFVVAGCSMHAEAHLDVSVSKAKLESQVSGALQKQIGKPPTAVACDGDLAGKVGAMQHCVLTDGPTKFGVTVTVTKAEGTNVDFNVKVDDHPLPS